MGSCCFASFTVCHRETDLWISINGGVDVQSMAESVLERIKRLRRTIDEYGERDRRFFSAMAPYSMEDAAPPVVTRMFGYGERAGVGPMASVAGLFAQEIGEWLNDEFGIDECIVENGGDIYMNVAEPATVSIYAGSSPLSNLVALEVDPVSMPLGICTSSGTVGHSYSMGSADAVTVACHDAGLADAFATAFGNRVHTKGDIDGVLEKAGGVPEILHTLIIMGDHLGLRGHLALRAVPR